MYHVGLWKLLCWLVEVCGTLWVCGSGWVLAGVSGWAGGRYHVGLWKWVGVGWWEVCV